MLRLEKTNDPPVRIGSFILILGLLWTALVAASLMWNIRQQRLSTYEAARIQARGAFMKDVIYRRWNAGHGGVYVQKRKASPPNPYLDVKDRDIVTPSGKVLTLMNPAYMTRQVHEMGLKAYGVRGHITSLNPIRPENKPDQWEAKALQGFQEGKTEVSSVKTLSEDAYMRLMRPLITEKGCLQCHQKQGYKAGDIRGGISVSVPMAPFFTVERKHFISMSLGYGLLWLAGVVGLGLGALRISRQINARKKIQQVLKKSESRMAEAQRIANIGSWDWDIKNDKLVCSDEIFRMFGVQSQIHNATYENFLKFVHPEDRPHVIDSVNKALQEVKPLSINHRVVRPDGSLRTVFQQAEVTFDNDGNAQRMMGTVQDVTQAKIDEREREKLIHDLKKALADVKQLSGLLPICSGCKKIRDDKGYWTQIEKFIEDHSEADFSHGICPKCAKVMYPDMNLYEDDNAK